MRLIVFKSLQGYQPQQSSKMPNSASSLSSAAASITQSPQIKQQGKSKFQFAYLISLYIRILFQIDWHCFEFQLNFSLLYLFNLKCSIAYRLYAFILVFDNELQQNKVELST